jgi:hypothetical protein
VELRLARNWAERSSLSLHASDPTLDEVGSGPLWPALLSVLQLGETPPPLEAAALSAMCAAATLVAVVVATADARGRQAASWAALVLATCVPFAIWSTGGTAHALAMLTGFLVWWVASASDDERGLFGVGAASWAHALSRPDGGIQAVVAAACGGARAGRPLRTAGAALIGVAGATVLRTVVFGAPVPWSAVHPILTPDPLHGIGALMAAIATLMPIPAVLLAGPWAGSIARSALPPAVAAMLPAVVAGGDADGLGSSLTGALPFLAVVAGCGAARAPAAARAAVATATLFAAMPHLGIGPSVPWAGNAGRPAVVQWRAAIDEVREARAAAIALRRVGGGRQTVVASPSGAIGWFSRWRVLDPSGRYTPWPPPETEQPALRYRAERPTVLDLSFAPDEERVEARLAEWRGWAAADPALHATWGPRRDTTPEGVWLFLHRWDDEEDAIRAWVHPPEVQPQSAATP